MSATPTPTAWDAVLDFWFPEGRSLDVRAEDHRNHWMWRMRGGADAQIVAGFSGITKKAAAGDLDDWASNPHGRLALIVVLDQFSRSLWRDTPRAFAQDNAALSLVLEGYSNGHYDALETPWFKTVYNLPLGHCEGHGHLERLNLAVRLTAEVLARVPIHLRPEYEFAGEQARRVHKVIETFGRHPHRNACLGRPSTPEEVLYILEGKFPHLNTPANAPNSSSAKRPVSGTAKTHFSD